MPRLYSAKNALQKILKDEYNSNRGVMDEWVSSYGGRRSGNLGLYLSHEVGMAAKHGFIVRSNRVCNAGDSQAIIDIGNGYLAKAPVFPAQPKGSRPLAGKVYSPPGFFVISVGFDDPVIQSYVHFATLAKSWSGINVVEHSYVRALRRESGSAYEVLVTEPGNQFAIVKDLCEDGKFHVKEVEDSDFDGLGNGRELKFKFESAMRTLMDMYMSRFSNPVSPPKYEYWLHINGHKVNGEPRDALRKMFLLRISLEDNLGGLWLGDLDHVYLSKPEQGSRGAWG